MAIEWSAGDGKCKKKSEKFLRNEKEEKAFCKGAQENKIGKLIEV